MKVYCVWAWDNYYPSPANGNLKGIYTDLALAEAKEAILCDTGVYDSTKITVEYVDDSEEEN